MWKCGKGAATFGRASGHDPTPSAFDFGSWRLERFGDTAANGPSDATSQMPNARDVIAGSAF
jgi:hypothetical protein